MNIASIRSFEGSSSARPESEPGGRGIGFEGLLRSQIGASPSREARAEPRNADGSREARSEAGASERSRTARGFPAETAGTGEIDEADAAETTTAASAAAVDESARPERPPSGAATAADLEEVEVAVPDPSRVGAVPSQAPGAADPAAPSARSGAGSESAAVATGTPVATGTTVANGTPVATGTTDTTGTTATAATASGQAVARSGSAAGDSGAAVSSGSGDGIVRAASDADSARALAERGGATQNGGPSASTASTTRATTTAGEAVAASPPQEAASDSAARVGGRGSTPEAGASDGARTETLDARIAGRAVSLAGGASDRAASTGSSRLEGATPAIESRAAGAAAEGPSDPDRRGAQDREGGDRPPAGDRSIDPRLAERGSSDALSSRVGVESAVSLGSAAPATPAADGSTSATAGVPALPAASVGATVQTGVEAPPAGASTPVPAADALAVQTEWLATRGGGSARLVLHPPELGEIAIRVHVRDGGVDVVMIAQEAAAKAIAEEQSDRLAQAFSARDLRMGRFEVRQAETGAATEESPDAQLGNPDARDGGQSRRAPNEAAGGNVDGVAGMPRSPDGPPAGLPPQLRSTPAERSIDLRI